MTRGFSLIETIVALGILTCALVALAHVLAVGAQMAAGARYRTAATMLAQQKLEQLRAEAQLTETPSAVEHRNGSGLRVCETADPCDEAFATVRWSISAVGSHPDLVMVRVVVSHPRRNHGDVRSFAVRPRSLR